MRIENSRSPVVDRARQEKNKKKSVIVRSELFFYCNIYFWFVWVTDSQGSAFRDCISLKKSRGDVSVLRMHGDLQAQGFELWCLEMFVFSRKECTFLPLELDVDHVAAVAVLALMSLDGRLRVRIVDVDLEVQSSYPNHILWTWWYRGKRSVLFKRKVNLKTLSVCMKPTILDNNLKVTIALHHYYLQSKSDHHPGRATEYPTSGWHRSSIHWTPPAHSTQARHAPQLENAQYMMHNHLDRHFFSLLSV